MARPILYSGIALLTAGIGAVIMLRSLGVFGPVATANGPAWLGVVTGFVFLAGAACVLVKAFYGVADCDQSELPSDVPAPVRFFYNSLGVAIVAGLGALFSWIAFGPGARDFSGSGAFLGPLVGRAMFGLGAVLTGLVLVWSAMRWLRRRSAGEQD